MVICVVYSKSAVGEESVYLGMDRGFAVGRWTDQGYVPGRQLYARRGGKIGQLPREQPGGRTPPMRARGGPYSNLDWKGESEEDEEGGAHELAMTQEEWASMDKLIPQPSRPSTVSAWDDRWTECMSDPVRFKNFYLGAVELLEKYTPEERPLAVAILITSAKIGRWCLVNNPANFRRGFKPGAGKKFSVEGLSEEPGEFTSFLRVVCPHYKEAMEQSEHGQEPSHVVEESGLDEKHGGAERPPFTESEWENEDVDEPLYSTEAGPAPPPPPKAKKRKPAEELGPLGLTKKGKLVKAKYGRADEDGPWGRECKECARLYTWVIEDRIKDGTLPKGALGDTKLPITPEVFDKGGSTPFLKELFKRDSKYQVMARRMQRERKRAVAAAAVLPPPARAESLREELKEPVVAALASSTTPAVSKRVTLREFVNRRQRMRREAAALAMGTPAVEIKASPPPIKEAPHVYKHVPVRLSEHVMPPAKTREPRKEEEEEREEKAIQREMGQKRDVGSEDDEERARRWKAMEPSKGITEPVIVNALMRMVGKYGLGKDSKPFPDDESEALDELVREEYGLPEGSGPFTLFVASDSRFVGQMESWDHMMHEEEEGGLEPGYYLYLKTGELYYIDEYGGKLVKL